LIGDAGQVSIQGDQTLFVNFGSKERAQQFLEQRLGKGFESEIKSFEVPSSFVDDLRANAVPESLAKQFKDNPILVDITKAPDQFGLRADQIAELQKILLQGTGKTGGGG
jgi:filamentous hemagglutinin